MEELSLFFQSDLVDGPEPHTNVMQGFVRRVVATLRCRAAIQSALRPVGVKWDGNVPAAAWQEEPGRVHWPLPTPLRQCTYVGHCGVCVCM